MIFFQVLQSVFLKSTSSVLGGTILDAISTIYHGDNANFFLLQVDFVTSCYSVLTLPCV